MWTANLGQRRYDDGEEYERYGTYIRKHDMAGSHVYVYGVRNPEGKWPKPIIPTTYKTQSPTTQPTPMATTHRIHHTPQTNTHYTPKMATIPPPEPTYHPPQPTTTCTTSPPPQSNAQPHTLTHTRRT
jgi:hypothetical protein